MRRIQQQAEVVAADVLNGPHRRRKIGDAQARAEFNGAPHAVRGGQFGEQAQLVERAPEIALHTEPL
jgi:hypothetical protein